MQKVICELVLPDKTDKELLLFEKRSRYSRGIAFRLDFFGNVEYAPLFNASLIVKDGYKFGNPNETISKVLGHNILINKLSKAGKLLVLILTEKHCIDAINNN